MTKNVLIRALLFLIGAGWTVFVCWMGGYDPMDRELIGVFVWFSATAIGAFMAGLQNLPRQ